MRWFVGGAVALAVLWVTYLASPYIALWNLADAIEHADARGVRRAVNLHALRISFAKQLVSEGLAAADRTGQIGAADRQLASGTISTMLDDPYTQELVAPAGVIKLVTTPDADDPAVKPLWRPSVGWILDGVRASHWRGFRNVYVSLPPNRPEASRFRVQLRLSRFTWRVVGIDLPANLRKRMAKELSDRVK